MHWRPVLFPIHYTIRISLKNAQVEGLHHGEATKPDSAGDEHIRMWCAGAVDLPKERPCALQWAISAWTTQRAAQVDIAISFYQQN